MKPFSEGEWIPRELYGSTGIQEFGQSYFVRPSSSWCIEPILNIHTSKLTSHRNSTPIFHANPLAEVWYIMSIFLERQSILESQKNKKSTHPKHSNREQPDMPDTETSQRKSRLTRHVGRVGRRAPNFCHLCIDDQKTQNPNLSRNNKTSRLSPSTTKHPGWARRDVLF